VDASRAIRYYPERMKRNTLLIVVVAIAGIFLLFDPLKYIRGNRKAVQKPPLSAPAVASLLEFAGANFRTPEDYVISTFASRDVVFLGEFYKIRQNVQLVSALVPRLYAAGVRNLGIEFALSDDQKDIDALVTAPQWSEEKARAITFDWLVTWGYQEYIDIYKAAWQLNRSLAAGAKPFRVVGLNLRQNWEALKSEKDLADPETVAKVLAYGVPDANMAEVIDREFVRRGEKALVYCSIQHAFTRYRSAEYEKNAASMKLPETRRAGNIVYAAIGSRAFTISLHSPWPDKGEQSGFSFPVDGSIDALIDALPEGRKSAGWNTEGTPLGRLPVRPGTYAAEGQEMTLSELCNGYIVQGPIAEYQPVTPIVGFVRPEDAEKASRNFPGSKQGTMTADQVNKLIVDDAEAMRKLFVQFR